VQGYLQIVYWTSNIRRRLSIIGLSESHAKQSEEEKVHAHEQQPGKFNLQNRGSDLFWDRSRCHFEDGVLLPDPLQRSDGCRRHGGPRLCKSDENSCVSYYLGSKVGGISALHTSYRLPAHQSCWRPPASDQCLYSAEQLSRSPYDKDDRGKCLKERRYV
jgi:hypothetical protein